MELNLHDIWGFQPKATHPKQSGGGSVLKKQKAFGPILQLFGVTVGLEKILAWNN